MKGSGATTTDCRQPAPEVSLATGVGKHVAGVTDRPDASDVVEGEIHLVGVLYCVS